METLCMFFSSLYSVFYRKKGANPMRHAVFHNSRREPRAFLGDSFRKTILLVPSCLCVAAILVMGCYAEVGKPVVAGVSVDVVDLHSVWNGSSKHDPNNVMSLKVELSAFFKGWHAHNYSHPSFLCLAENPCSSYLPLAHAIKSRPSLFAFEVLSRSRHPNQVSRFSIVRKALFQILFRWKPSEMRGGKEVVFLWSWRSTSQPISGYVFSLRDRPKIASSVITAISVDVVDDKALRNLNSEESEDDSSCHKVVLDAIVIQSNASPAVLVEIPSLFSSVERVPTISRCFWRPFSSMPEVVDGPCSPSENSGFRIIRKALFQIGSWRKRIDLYVGMSDKTDSIIAAFAHFISSGVRATRCNEQLVARSFYPINHNFATPAL